MKQPQLFFDKIIANNDRLRELRSRYKDALETSARYAELQNELKTLRQKNKQVLLSIQSEMTAEIEEMETLQQDIKADKELMSDAALTMLMKGERVTVQDKYHNTYDPEFSVKFKKSK